MSADEPGRGPNLEVDPSERSDQRQAQTTEKDKDKDKDASAKGGDAPSASSKGINPVQHSE